MSQSEIDRTDKLSGKMDSSRAFLKVVAYPWGVEFELPDEEESK